MMSSSETPPAAVDLDAVVRALPRAWDRVLERRAAPGIDGLTVTAYAAQSAQRLSVLGGELREGTWRPKPGKRIQIPGDAERPIVVPVVEDRIVQRAVALALGPLVEARLGPSARAYRAGIGVAQTTAEVERRLRSGRHWYARTDIEKFFDRIDRERLLAILGNLEVDSAVLGLVERLMRAGAVEGVAWTDPLEGVSQGSALSPLLSNAYLADVDREMIESGTSYFRYADDVLVLGETEVDAGEALARFGEAVDRLGLRLGARKTRRGHAQAGFDFLGVRFDAAGRAGAARAYTALGERVGELLEVSPTEVAPAASLVADFERWYGPLRPAQIDTLALLAVAVIRRVAQSPERSALLLELAERRVTASPDGTLPMATHVQLAEAWATLEDDVALAATLVDTRAAVRAGAGDEELSRLGVAIGVAAEVVSSLSGRHDDVPSVLGRAGRPRLARAARRWLIGDARSAVVPAASEAIETAAALQQAFRERVASWAIERRDGRGQRRFTPIDEEPTDEAFLSHCGGGGRLGITLVGAGGGTRLIALRAIGRRDAALGGGSEADAVAREVGLPVASLMDRRASLEARVHDTLVAYLRSARRLGLDGLLEDGGRYDRRLWLLLDRPITVRDAQRLFARLLAEGGDAPGDVCLSKHPATDAQRPDRAPIALPLGCDPGTRRMSRFVTEGGSAVDSAAMHLKRAPNVSASRIFDLVRRGAASASPLRIADQQAVKAVAGIRSARRILEGCALVRALADKAHRLGFLDPEERASLFEVLGHLPGREAELALEAALAGARSKDSRHLRLRLERLGSHPISCERLKTRHAVMAGDAACECTFQRLRGRMYPTPLLHGLHPRDIPAFNPKRPTRPPPPRAKESAKKDPSSTPAKPTAVDVAEAPQAQLRTDTVTAGAREVAAVQAALARLQQLRRQNEGVVRAISKTEQALATIFHAAGVVRVRLPEGTLVMVSRDPPRFVLEV